MIKSFFFTKFNTLLTNSWCKCFKLSLPTFSTKLSNKELRNENLSIKINLLLTYY